jgi:lysophospholipase L1-like esterase
MFRPISSTFRRVLPGLALLLGLVGQALAADNPAIQPVPRANDWWTSRHANFVVEAQRGGVDLLFLGDSITDFWRAEGASVWNKEYVPLKAANFGLSGDCTQHLLWRIQHGELDNLASKAVVLMIGTNNQEPAEQVAAGIAAIVAHLRQAQPQARILLLSIFPKGWTPGPYRERLKRINAIIAKLDDGAMVRYLDLFDKFLDADGNMGEDIMPDGLHPSRKGYQIWADAMREPLKKMREAK